MRRIVRCAVGAMGLFAVVLTGCAAQPAPILLRPARSLATLPPRHNTPDGMCLTADGSVIVSVPNVNNDSAAPQIMRLTPDNELVDFCDPPVHPTTGRAYPFGICVDPATGDLYYADLQWFAGKEPNWLSRVIRIPVHGSRPGKPEVFAEGMVVANAVAIHDGYLYTTDTTMMPGTYPLVTGVYRFKLGKSGYKVARPLDRDPHLVATIQTHNPEVPFGADGLCFDKAGNMYIGNFADGTIHKVSFDAAGKPITPRPAPIWASSPGMRSCDGLFFDHRTDTIYVADSLANAVQAVSLDGTVKLYAQDPTDTGVAGRLDQPCEVLIRGDELIISNFDMPIPGGVNQTFEPPNGLSVIDMK